MDGFGPRVVIFTCNWNAHDSLQEAANLRLNYPPGVRPLKVDCLGQVGSSAILMAFEKGADGVMLVGCSPEECHYEFGSRRAAELFEEVCKLAQLLGFRDSQLQFYQVHAGEGEALVGKVRDFVSHLKESQMSPAKAREDLAADAGD
ncbi:MAG TPA: hydrogenase iron-sulfur subunit [Anaerolineae bacterium]|nr:hydrogenase iron-sulfur subunit [Anaerolineae bacterium]